MARITNKLMREKLRTGFFEGSTVISEALYRYFHYHRVSLSGTTFNSNCQVNGFYRKRGGEVGVSIYWQGDSTDGTDCIALAEFNRNSTVIIPAEHYFDGERTRCTHDDLRITKAMVEEAMKMLADILEKKAKRK